jgi:hypothetical protein
VSSESVETLSLSPSFSLYHAARYQIDTRQHDIDVRADSIYVFIYTARRDQAV